MNYGDMIREAREAAGLTQAGLAEAIQLDPSMVSKLEKGKVFVEPDVFRRLTNVLRSLRPADLANAIGYEVTVSGADRIPRPIALALLQMTPRQMEGLAALLGLPVQAGQRSGGAGA